MDNNPNAKNDSNQKPKNSKRTKIIIVLSICILIIVIILWVIWYLFFSFYQSTDDAYVGGNIVELTSRQNGTVIAYYADNTNLVEQGQLLVQLDPTDFLIAYEMQKAALALTARRVQALWDQVGIREANLKTAQARLELAKQEYRDRAALVENSAVSTEEYEQYKTNLETTEASVTSAQYELESAINARGSTPKQEHPEILESKTSLVNAYIALSRCWIYAPTTGFVAQRTVQVGKSINPNIPLLSIVPLNQIWVDANFKETQLADIRIGQHADVTVDIYGSDVNFNGKVIGFYPGSGSVFALLPPQNATGNWIKIVQRVPVRIYLSCDILKEHPLFLGLSCSVSVDTSNTEGVMLAYEPTQKLQAATNIYNINLQLVYEEAERIINTNLQ